MKKLIYPLVLASLLLVGCVQEEMVEEVRMFRGQVEDIASTRTSLGEDNKVLWVKNDLISVFEDNQYPSAFKITIHSAGKASADFVKTSDATSGTAIGANVALYPYTESAKCARLSTGDYRLSAFQIPSVQTYAANSFDSGAFLMAAMTPLSDNNFTFKNLCGILKLQLKGSDAVRYIIVKGNDGEQLSGPALATVYSDGSSPQLLMTTGAGTDVTLDCGESGVKLSTAAATPFLITLPPVAFSKGFTVTVVGVDGGEMVMSTDKANPVTRSSILRMPVKTFEPEVSDTPSVTTIETVSLSFDEAVIKVTVCKAVQYSGGYKLKSEFNLDQVAREANWKMAPRITDSFVYEGSLTAFPAGGTAAPVSPGQTYVVWLAPYASGQTTVKSDQILYKEITIPDITSGGSRNVTVKSFNAGFKSVEAEVSSSGARAIYAAFVTSSEFASLSSNAAIVSWLKANSTPIVGENGIVTRPGLEPGTSMRLLAIAVDDSGRYGSILKSSYSTKVPAFNENISIELSAVNEGKVARVKVAASGADIRRFYYFAGETSGSSWARILGGSRESAEEFMAVNNDNYLISNTDDEPFTDGCIVMDNVMIDEEHVVVVMAEDTDGNFSRAHILTFVPELDLGDFVLKTKSQWSSKKPKVTFGDCELDDEFYMIKWSVTPASGTTAYTVCAHPNTMEDCTTPQELAVRVYNLGVEVVSGKMETMLYGDKANLVYVTWRDSSGNFYEPVMFAVPQ